MKRAALIAAALAAGCVLRDARVSEPVCNRDPQCQTGQVCFANECRAPASALESVVIQVTPPSSSPYSAVQRSLDLKTSSVATIDLPLPSRLQGVVVQDAPGGGTATPLGGVQLEFRDAQPNLPGRGFTVAAQTDADGKFDVRLGEATWQVRIVPPAPLPPMTQDVPQPDAPDAVLHLPPTTQLTTITGTLKSAGAAFAGARVTPVTPQGVAEGAPATVDSSGRFQLLLPPPPVDYLLRVGDAADGGVSFADGPIPTFDDDALGFRSTATTSNAVDVDVGALPAAATLGGTVKDAAGSPVAGAHVSALSQDGAKWTLTRSAMSAADGSFELGLREGRYLVEAAPGLDPKAPALSGERTVDVRAGGAPIALVCPAKARGLGQVLRSTGKPIGPGATVIATRLAGKLAAARAGTTSATDLAGTYTLIGDPGTYRLEVVPPAESGEPRQLAFLELRAPLSPSETVPIDAVVLPPPLVVVGVVRGPAGTGTTPVAGASIDVYAVNAARDGNVRLGAALTDTSGRYRVVLPDVSQPAVTSPGPGGP